MRGARRAVVIALLVLVAIFLPITVLACVAWFTSIGQPDISHPCYGKYGESTCYSGPTTDMFVTLLCGGFTAAALTSLTVLVVRWRRQDAVRARLLSIGVRVPAVLVAAVPTRTTVNRQPVLRLVFEARPGGGVVRAEEQSVIAPPIGTRATIVYDPAVPTNALVVEEVEKLESARPGLTAMRDAVAANLETALAELRAKVDRGQLTEADYQAQRQEWLRLLETPTDRPLS